MKFAHLSDIHIGSWRDPQLREASTSAFIKAIDICIEEQVDFILISGDLFNTSLPTIERLKIVVAYLRELKKRNIPVYIIAGSHDFSPSGKTMLDVLEKAELFINVVKGDVVDGTLQLRFTIDQKTGTKITGMLGKKGLLDKKYYERLELKNLEQEEGFKIFMFHTAITEFKPSDLELMDSVPLSLFPKHFNYYAGGHVHAPLQQDIEHFGLLTYPGALFPNNFKELEKFHHGGFYIYDESIENNIRYIPIELYSVVSLVIDCNMKTPEEIKELLLIKLNQQPVKNSLVTLRLKGVLRSGKIRDINFKEIIEQFYAAGAYLIMKNTAQLSSEEFEEIKIDTKATEELEQNLIKQHLGQIAIEGVTHEAEFVMSTKLLQLLATEKKEGERVIDYEERLKREFLEGLNLDLF